MIKDRNGKDQTEAEEIKKRWQEYTEELYKKGLNDPDNHNGVVTHPEPGVQESEVRWTLGSNTTKSYWRCQNSRKQQGEIRPSLMKSATSRRKQQNGKE